ncbi:hypothetical protein Y032_0131g1640 [Ancylostoma ceylanicum]|uniref:Reverse transcriptase domain-containing protein n=1 Tax=Ancylostoma ceylanicum TaxID=53326 RepID=A0A016T6W5_9BILA|nr:hypothetical protein Y032_0131g1640 [Ancylostoma ceylanicum]
METISSDLQSTTPWTLLYADDVMIAASTREELQQKVQAWKHLLEQYGMRLNIKKTEYVECGEQTPGTIFVDDAELPKAPAFKYLGSRISADGTTLGEAEYRANAAWSKWRQVRGVMFYRKVLLKRCVWSSGKRLAAHAHGRWFDRAPTANQAIHPSGVGKLVPEESGRMRH